MKVVDKFQCLGLPHSEVLEKLVIGLHKHLRHLVVSGVQYSLHQS